MPLYEYKVVPAPARCEKIKGVRAPKERFAQTLAGVINEMAEQGWEYQRAETLPCEEKKNFFSRPRTVYQNVLVFRRVLTEAIAAPLRHDVERRSSEPVPEPPTPAAMAASLMPNQPEGAAPRITPFDKTGRDAPNVTRIMPGRTAPEEAERRGE